MEKPGRLQSTGLQTVRHDLVTNQQQLAGSSTHASLYARKLQDGMDSNNSLLDTGIYVPSSRAGKGVRLRDGNKSSKNVTCGATVLCERTGRNSPATVQVLGSAQAPSPGKKGGKNLSTHPPHLQSLQTPPCREIIAS